MSGDLIDRLRLARSPGIGPVTFRQLIARFGDASAALAAVPATWPGAAAGEHRACPDAPTLSARSSGSRRSERAI